MLQKSLIALLAVFALAGAFLFTKATTSPVSACTLYTKTYAMVAGRYCYRYTTCTGHTPWYCHGW